ncbi:MAG: hypothetical protein KDH90_21195 [Anaerolineae bacterium]|nr:hypothetical protein [Anaerolineae bacterium]
MMPETSGKNYSVYFSGELVEKFEAVQAHLGKGISQSFAHLVEAKYDEIQDGQTRRAQIAGLRADLETWMSDITGQIAIIDERQSLLVEMMRRLVQDGVQADALFCAVEDAVQNN